MSMFSRSSLLMRSLVLLLLVSLAACSKDETGRYDGGLTPAPMLYGAVSKGPVEGAAVTVYRLNDDGTRGARLAGEFVTADDGSWSGVLPDGLVGPFLVVARGGSYIDEATGNRIVLAGADEITSLVQTAPRPGQPVTASISPLTDALARSAQQLAAGGLTAADAVAQVRSTARSNYGFDPLSVRLVDPLSVPASATLAEQRYAALLGGLSRLARDARDNHGAGATRPFALVMALAEDMADGLLDGNGVDGQPISVANNGPGSTVLPVLDATGLTALVTEANAFAAANPTLPNNVLPGLGSQSLLEIPSYNISGTISGATDGVNVIWELRVGGAIRNDGGNGNGPVTFTPAAGLPQGTAWTVVINSAPAGQACVVTNGSGTLAADVANVLISCSDEPVIENYSIGGTISGATDGVNVIWELRVDGAIRNDGGNGNGPVTFTPAAGLPQDTIWTVVINSAPAGQTCAVTNGSGTLTADVSDVAINCEDTVVEPASYSVSGSITGASGAVTWETRVGGNFYHDGMDGNGAVTFTYGDGIASGSDWSVTVLSEPAGQDCTVSNGSGTLTADVSNVAISCSDTVVGPDTYSISGSIAGASANVQWETRIGGAFYHDGNNGNGAVTFTPPEGMDSGSSWSVVVTGEPAGQDCTVSNGSGTLANDVTTVQISCSDEVVTGPGDRPLYDFSALNLQPAVPAGMVPTPPAGVPTDPATQIEGLFQQLGDSERANIFAPAPVDITTRVDSIYSTSHSYQVIESTADQRWYRQLEMGFGADGEPDTADDFIRSYTVYPYGPGGVSFSFNHPGADGQWFTADDGNSNLAGSSVVYFPTGAVLEYEGASEGAVLIIPCLDVGADGAPFTADDQPGCSLGYQVAVIDGQGNRGQVITYNNAGTDGLWFTADDRVKNYTLLTYNGTGVGIATVVYNGDGADNTWFNSDDDVQLHTLTKLGDDFKPRYTATYNGRGTDNTWFSADDVVQAWTYYGYDANGNNILVATHTNKGSDATWFTADDSATAIISLKDENGYPIITGEISSGGMGPDGIWLSGDETPRYSSYTYSEHNDAGALTRTVTLQSSGPDGKWFTSDDQPGLYGNYWTRELTPDNQVQRQINYDASLLPGAQAFSDAHISRYIVYNADRTLSVDVSRSTNGFGADNTPFTEDDILQWPYSVITPGGIDQFNQPGPDGQWFTADDVRSGYTVYSYDGTRRTQQQFNAADEMISYTEIADATADSYRLNRYDCSAPGNCTLSSYNVIEEDINGNPLWTFYYTIEDVISYVSYTERDANGNIVLENIYSANSGPDGTFGTFDDFTYFSWYTYNSNGDVVATGTERIGEDGIWNTGDDTRSIDQIYLLGYGPDELASNAGLRGDTCATLPTSPGASGDIQLLVRDQNGDALAGVIARLGPNGATVTTDANGEASFTGLSGTQDVHLFKDGYAWESFYCVAPGVDVTLRSTLASLSLAKEQSKVLFQINPGSVYVTLRLLDAEGRSVAARSYASGSGGQAGSYYGELLFDLPPGSDVSGELWVLESDSYGRLLSAQSLGQQSYTTVASNDYHAVREQISVSLPVSDLLVVAYDGTLVSAGSGRGSGLYVSLGGLYELPFNYESSVGTYGGVAALAPGVDVSLPALMQPSGVGSGTGNWSAWYPGSYPQIGEGSFVASIVTGFQYPAVVATQQDSSATPSISWMPATQKDSAAFLSANTVELHSAAGGLGYQSHWTIHTPPGEDQVTLPAPPAGISGPALPQGSYRIVVKARAVPALGYHDLIGSEDLYNLDPALATEVLTTGDPIQGVQLLR